MTACSITGSRIDYCNSLFFFGITAKNLNKLVEVTAACSKPRIQNCLHVEVSKHSSHSAQQLFQSHWLPARARIQFKLSKLCFRSRTLDELRYLSAVGLLHSYRRPRKVRSSTQDLLTACSSLQNSGRQSSILGRRIASLKQS